MKNLLALLVSYLLITGTSAYAEQRNIAEFDGNTWAEMERYHKLIFISGFMAGSEYVIDNNVYSQDNEYDSEKVVQIVKKPKKSFSREDVVLLLGDQRKSFNYDLVKYHILRITNSQLVEGLDLFYGDFKNKQIKLSDAIYVIKKQIKGAPPEEIEAILQYLRADKDFEKLFYTDKDGKKKRASLP